MTATPTENSMPVEAHHLALLGKGDSAIVTGIANVVDAEQAAIKTRLLELGFVPGETVRVVAESFPQRDPMAVRIGNATFALRRHEAAMIHVTRPAIARRLDQHRINTPRS